MDKSKKSFLSIVVILIFALFLAVSCARAPERRPTPPQNTTPPQNVTPPQTQPRADMTESQRIAQRLSDEAKTVEGVRSATVVVSGNTAIVGINLDRNIEASKTQAIKDEIEDRFKRVEPRIDRVVVTADADLVKRIENLGKGVAEGRPLSEFTKEFNAILTRMTPSKG